MAEEIKIKYTKDLTYSGKSHIKAEVIITNGVKEELGVLITKTHYEELLKNQKDRV